MGSKRGKRKDLRHFFCDTIFTLLQKSQNHVYTKLESHNKSQDKNKIIFTPDKEDNNIEYIE